MSDFITHPELAQSLIYGIIRQQAAPLVEDDWAETLAALGDSPKAFPTWVRGVINDPTPSNNGLYVCLSADPDAGTSTWSRIVTMELLASVLGTPGQGAAGAAGNQILFGVGAPANSLGSAGDVYFNSNNWDIFKKGTSSWVNQGSLRGADGRDGVDGRNGTNGTNGADGRDGVDGVNGGSTDILFGIGTPATALGQNGDVYFNQNTWSLYEKVGAVWVNRGSVKGADGVAGADGQSPQLLNGGSNPAPNVLGVAAGTWYLNTATLELFSREPGGWVSLGSLKGPEGVAGPAGTSSRFLFGNGLPAAGLGNSGDAYIDKDSYNLYGKTGNVWELEGNIRGVAGVDGAVASRLRTYTGAGAPNNALGLDDDIYINQSNGGLYAKSAGSWALSLILKGEPGADGAPGRGTLWYLSQGLPPANVGEPGDLALSTVDGTLYQRGVTVWTATGASLRGLTGQTGLTGASGIGSRIYSGAGAPAGTLGIATDFYVRYNGQLYEKNAGGSWVSAGQLDFSGVVTTGGGGTTNSRVQFYYGAGLPDNNATLPAGLPDGSIYTDQTAGDLYSRVNSAWEFVLHLVGTAGAQGAAGAPGQSITGPAGRNGTNGTNGAAGAPGLPGTTLLHRYASGAPANSLGVDGETYTDMASPNWNHYNKQSGAWTLLGTLKGAAGSPGSRIIFLAANPGSTDGLAGYMAINTVSGDYFEKVDASTWTLRGNIKGPKGDTGATGAQGAPGAAGTGGTSTGSGSANYPAQSGATSLLFLQSTGVAGSERWASPQSLRVGFDFDFVNQPSTQQRFFVTTTITKILADAGVATLSYAINGGSAVNVPLSSGVFTPTSPLVFSAGALITWALTYATGFTEAFFQVQGTEPF